MMKIVIKSNFVIPGLEDKEWVDIDRPQMTLREFLGELSARSPDPLHYVEPGADRIDPDDWGVYINDCPYQDVKEGLERPLKDGDVVTINIQAQGGG
jgi:hypothetical protein